MNHRSPHLRVVDAHFHHFLGHISQPGAAAHGSPSGQFSYFGPRSPLTASILDIGYIYQVLVAEAMRQLLGWSFLRELVPGIKR
jgi:hypothetical protein